MDNIRNTDEYVDMLSEHMTREERAMAQSIYENHMDKYGLTEEQIHHLLKGREKEIAERMKEVDDIHIRRVGGQMVVSRYSEEKKRVDEAPSDSEITQLRNEVKELKEIILKNMQHTNDSDK